MQITLKSSLFVCHTDLNNRFGLLPGVGDKQSAANAGYGGSSFNSGSGKISLEEEADDPRGSLRQPGGATIHGVTELDMSWVTRHAAEHTWSGVKMKIWRNQHYLSEQGGLFVILWEIMEKTVATLVLLPGKSRGQKSPVGQTHGELRVTTI